MIELRTDKEAVLRLKPHALDSVGEWMHDCLAAHAIKQAIEYARPGFGRINEDFDDGWKDAVAYIERRAAELLTTWLRES